MVLTYLHQLDPEIPIESRTVPSISSRKLGANLMRSATWGAQSKVDSPLTHRCVWRSLGALVFSGRCPVLSMRTNVSGHISLQFGKELRVCGQLRFGDSKIGTPAGALRLPATMGCLKTAMGVGKPNAWWIWWWMPLILTYWYLFLGWEARSTRSGYRRLSSGNLFIAMENGSLMLWLYVAEQDDFQSRARWSLHEQLAGQKPSGWPPDIPVMHQLTPLLAIFS